MLYCWILANDENEITSIFLQKKDPSVFFRKMFVLEAKLLAELKAFKINILDFE